LRPARVVGFAQHGGSLRQNARDHVRGGQLEAGIGAPETRFAFSIFGADTDRQRHAPRAVSFGVSSAIAQ
jgi:hypothetical protein